MDGVGSIAWWGYSPAINIFEQFQHLEKGATINILLAYCSDARHIIKTMGNAFKFKEVTVHFYVMESSLETMLRQLLLLHICRESPSILGLQEKAELLLEVLGNTLVRQQTAEYISQAATEFIKLLTSSVPDDGVCNFRLLKFKERDGMERILKFWRDPKMQSFDVSRMWDIRLRSHLGVRFDSKDNIYDWDRQMKLGERGAKIISRREYNLFRNTGIGFQPRDGDYDVPNRTLASGFAIKDANGDKTVRSGYWGDIITGPYIPFGIECEENPSLFKTQNNMFTKEAVDVALYNVIALLYQMTYSKSYEESQSDNESHRIVEIDADYQLDSAINIKNIKISFLPLTAVNDLTSKSMYSKLFNFAFISFTTVHLLNHSFPTVLADKCRVFVEGVKYVTDLKNDAVSGFSSKVEELAKSANLVIDETYDPFRHHFMKFLYSE